MTSPESNPYRNPSSGTWFMATNLYQSGLGPRSSEPDLKLFQTLDEFSSTVEPLSLSPYECIPSSKDDSRSSTAPPKSLADIWSNDSSLSIDSNPWTRSHPDQGSTKGKGYTDYSHMLQDISAQNKGGAPYENLYAPRNAPVQQSRSVILCLSSLIR